MALGDATLQAVQSLGNDETADQIRRYLAEHFGMQVRPNHLGMALQRHRRTGRLQEEDGSCSVVPPRSAETVTAESGDLAPLILREGP